MKETIKLVIGRSDKIDFPELGLENIPAKIDSGAFTCSIHCENIRAFYKGDEHYVHFTVFDGKKETEKETPAFASKRVRNSFGQMEYRYTIKTELILFGKSFLTEVALTSRAKMKYPVLIGRKLLGEQFIIDVTKRDLSFKSKSKAK